MQRYILSSELVVGTKTKGVVAIEMIRVAITSSMSTWESLWKKKSALVMPWFYSFMICLPQRVCHNASWKYYTEVQNLCHKATRILRVWVEPIPEWTSHRFLTVLTYNVIRTTCTDIHKSQSNQSAQHTCLWVIAGTHTNTDGTHWLHPGRAWANWESDPRTFLM